MTAKRDNGGENATGVVMRVRDLHLECDKQNTTLASAVCRSVARSHPPPPRPRRRRLFLTEDVVRTERSAESRKQRAPEKNQLLLAILGDCWE